MSDYTPAADLVTEFDLINHRARVIYGRSGQTLPWANAAQGVQDDLLARAERELWDEGRISMEPAS